MQYNQQRVLDRLIEMIKIDSPSYHEGPMTDYLQKYFEDRGYEVYRDQAERPSAATTRATCSYISPVQCPARLYASTPIRILSSPEEVSSPSLKMAF